MNNVAFIVVAVTTPAIFTLSNSVCPSTSISTKSPSPLNVVAVTTPTIFAPPARTFNPDLAVTIPIESILVTSSYVSVPPIVTLPVKVAAPETFISVSYTHLTLPTILRV